MTCDEVQPLLHPYSDGELDLVRQVAIEEHLAGCSTCAEQDRQLRVLREALASPELYHRAPAALRARLQSEPAPARRRFRFLRPLTIAAGILLLVGISAAMGMLVSGPRVSAEERVLDQVLAAHVRSLQVDHATDVVSSDRHTVKPWFQGKLDFAPEVPDLTPQGYELSGGRLDYLVDRPVAALVYHCRKHPINLFLWPAGSDDERDVRAFNRQGFHVRTWQQGGMVYWVISDLRAEELDEFVRVFQEKTSRKAAKTQRISGSWRLCGFA